MTTLKDIQYVMNAVGNRTSMTDAAGTTTWTYVNFDRLTNVNCSNGDTVGYRYNAVGNRTAACRDPVTADPGALRRRSGVW